MVLSYPLDPTQPFSIIDYDPINDTHKVSGITKKIRSTKWMPDKNVDFGGHESIFIVKINQLLTRSQKRQA